MPDQFEQEIAQQQQVITESQNKLQSRPVINAYGGIGGAQYRKNVQESINQAQSQLNEYQTQYAEYQRQLQEQQNQQQQQIQNYETAQTFYNEGRNPDALTKEQRKIYDKLDKEQYESDKENYANSEAQRLENEINQQSQVSFAIPNNLRDKLKTIAKSFYDGNITESDASSKINEAINSDETIKSRLSKVPVSSTTLTIPETINEGYKEIGLPTPEINPVKLVQSGGTILPPVKQPSFVESSIYFNEYYTQARNALGNYIDTKIPQKQPEQLPIYQDVTIGGPQTLKPTSQVTYGQLVSGGLGLSMYAAGPVAYLTSVSSGATNIKEAKAEPTFWGKAFKYGEAGVDIAIATFSAYETAKGIPNFFAKPELKGVEGVKAVEKVSLFEKIKDAAISKDYGALGKPPTTITEAIGGTLGDVGKNIKSGGRSVGNFVGNTIQLQRYELGPIGYDLGARVGELRNGLNLQIERLRNFNTLRLGEIGSRVDNSIFRFVDTAEKKTNSAIEFIKNDYTKDQRIFRQFTADKVITVDIKTGPTFTEILGNKVNTAKNQLINLGKNIDKSFSVLENSKLIINNPLERPYWTIKKELPKLLKNPIKVKQNYVFSVVSDEYADIGLVGFPRVNFPRDYVRDVGQVLSATGTKAKEIAKTKINFENPIKTSADKVIKFADANYGYSKDFVDWGILSERTFPKTRAKLGEVKAKIGEIVTNVANIKRERAEVLEFLKNPSKGSIVEYTYELPGKRIKTIADFEPKTGVPEFGPNGEVAINSPVSFQSGDQYISQLVQSSGFYTGKGAYEKTSEFVPLIRLSGGSATPLFGRTSVNLPGKEIILTPTKLENPVTPKFNSGLQIKTPTESPSSVENVNILDLAKEGNSQFVGPRDFQDVLQGQDNFELTKQKTEQQSKQGQSPKERQKIIPKIALNGKPPYNPDIIDSALKKLQPGYKTFVMRRGKKVILPGVRTRSEAIKTGENVVLTGAEATFGIESAKTQVPGVDIPYKPSESIFRTFRYSKGKKTYLSNEWIQKTNPEKGSRSGRLAAKSEVKSLWASKVSKNKRLKLW